MDDRGFPRVALDEVLSTVETGSRPAGGSGSDSYGIPSLGGENLRLDGSLDLDTVRRVPSEFFSSMRTGHLKPRDVLINKDGAQTGKVARYGGEFPKAAINEHLFLLRGTGAISQDYLYRALRSEETQRTIRSLITGSAQPGLNRSFLQMTRIALPVLEEQRRIAEILDTIDETIQATERVIAKLREVQVGLLQRLLPEGGLVHKTAARELPEGWHYRTLEEIAMNRDGRRIPIRAEDRLERRGPYPYYGASGIIDYIDDYLFDGTYVLLGEDGENVLSRSTPLAFVVTGRSWVNNHAHVFEARAGVDSRFLALVLERTDYAGIASGSAQPKITQSGLRQMRFPMPTYQVQTKLRERMQSVENSVASEIRHAEGLESVRSGLAADLLSGRVRTVAL